MSAAPAVQGHIRLFRLKRWRSALPALARQYRENQPCPHILLEDFLDPEIALHRRAGQEGHRTFHGLFRPPAGWVGEIGNDLAGQEGSRSLLAGQGSIWILR